MNASTAPKWIRFIASVLDRLHQIFDDQLKDSTAIQDGNKKQNGSSSKKAESRQLIPLLVCST